MKTIFKLILVALSLISFNSFADQGCLLNNTIYTQQLPNVLVYRNDYYSQEYENYTNPTVSNVNSIAYYKAPGQCGPMWANGKGPVYPENNVAQKNGCLVNGNSNQIGRTVVYSIVDNCAGKTDNLPLDDFLPLAVVLVAVFGSYSIINSKF